MKFKELLTVIHSKTYLNIVSENGHWLYECKAMFVPPDLLERKVKLLYIKRAFINELFIKLED